MANIIHIGANSYVETAHGEFEIPLAQLEGFTLNDVPPYSTVEITQLPLTSTIFNVTLSVLHAGGPGRAGEYSLSVKVFFAVPGSPNDATATAKGSRMTQYVRRIFEKPMQERAFRLGPEWVPFFYDAGQLLYVEAFYKDYHPWEENPSVAREVGPFVAQFDELSRFRDTLLFICHASEDRSFVDSLCSFLDSAEVPVWYDRREIRVGESVVQRINDGLGAASALVVVLSKASVEKPWVQKEFSAALMRQLQGSSIRVLSLLVETCEIPPLIADLRYADCRTDKARGFCELQAAVK